MLIKKHDERVTLSNLKTVQDGGFGLAILLRPCNGCPTTELRVSAISDEFCSHTLIDEKDGSRVRVIEASNDWPVAQVRRSLKEG